MRIVKGYGAEVILKYLLKKYDSNYEGRCHEFEVAGYFREGDIYTCFDNTSASCWVEQAKTKREAILWCKRKIDTEQLYFIS